MFEVLKSCALGENSRRRRGPPSGLAENAHAGGKALAHMMDS